MVDPKAVTNKPKVTKDTLIPAASATGPHRSALSALTSTIGKTGRTHGLISVNSPARYESTNSTLAIWRVTPFGSTKNATRRLTFVSGGADRVVSRVLSAITLDYQKFPEAVVGGMRVVCGGCASHNLSLSNRMEPACPRRILRHTGGIPRKPNF
jgi:hypothetical protein